MIGERLAELRKLNGEKQQVLAKALSVSVSTVRSWEHDKSSPDHSTLVAICRRYHTSSDFLLGLSDYDPSDKAGIQRYGHAYVPLDEALSRVVLDLSGRPGLTYNIDFTRAMIGRFDVDLFSEFFHGLVNHSMMTLHIDNLRGINAHHQAETVFKAFGRALRMAVSVDPRMAGKMPSTKGTLTA